MLGGMAIGFLLRRQEFSWINKVITSLIWVLLFLLGVEVGGNRQIVEGLATLGVEAFTITLACVLGSCIFAWGLWYLLYKKKGGKHERQFDHCRIFCSWNIMRGFSSHPFRRSTKQYQLLCLMCIDVQCRPKYRKRSTDLEKFPFAESKTDLPACCYYTGNHIGSCTG